MTLSFEWQRRSMRRPAYHVKMRLVQGLEIGAVVLAFAFLFAVVFGGV